MHSLETIARLNGLAVSNAARVRAVAHRLDERAHAERQLEVDRAELAVDAAEIGEYGDGEEAEWSVATGEPLNDAARAEERLQGFE